MVLRQFDQHNITNEQEDRPFSCIDLSMYQSTHLDVPAGLCMACVCTGVECFGERMHFASSCNIAYLCMPVRSHS